MPASRRGRPTKKRPFGGGTSSNGSRRDGSAPGVEGKNKLASVFSREQTKEDGGKLVEVAVHEVFPRQRPRTESRSYVVRYVGACGPGCLVNFVTRADGRVTPLRIY
jgi:hypothetical protein